MYQFLGHCDLDLFSRIVVSGAYPILFEVGVPKFCVWMHLNMVICSGPFLLHCDLDLVSIIIVSGAYCLYYLR